MNFKFSFLFTAILVGTLVFGSVFAEKSKVAPALPTAVSADPLTHQNLFLKQDF